MKYLKYLQSGLFAILLVVCAPLAASAEQLRIYQGDVSNPVRLAPGKEVVVETDFDIGVAAIGYYHVADFHTLSATKVRLVGMTEGRTTLSLFDADGNVRHVEVSVAPDAPNMTTVAIPSMPDAQIVPVSLVGTSSVSVFRRGAIDIETDKPFTPSFDLHLQVHDPSIADVTALSDRRIYILGKRLGTTTLTLLRDAPTDSTVIKIEVIEYGD